MKFSSFVVLLVSVQQFQSLSFVEVVVKIAKFVLLLTPVDLVPNFSLPSLN